jgi:hypothetical protein
MKLKLFSSVAVIALIHVVSVVDAQNQTTSNIKLLEQATQKQRQLHETLLQQKKTTGLYGSAPAFQYDSIYYESLSDETWTLNGRIIDIVYDGNNNKISEVEQRPEWINSQKRMYNYDSNNNMTERLDQYWDGTTWVNSYRWLYTYNGSDQLTNTTGQQYSDSVWVNTEKDDFTYDSNGNLKDDVFSLWHSIDFFLNSKKTYTYDSGNKLEKMVFFTYDYELNDWQKYLRQVYHYDGDLNDRMTTEYWTGEWAAPSEKVKRAFDDDDNVIGENYFFKQDTTWVKNGHVGYDYNNDGILKKVTFKNFLNGEVFNGFRTRYFFHTVEQFSIAKTTATTSTLIMADKAGITVYPNPSAGSFKVVLENNQPIKNIEVYNLLGVKVLEQISPEIKMDGAAKGIYLISVYNGEKMVQRKMIIE